MSLEALRQVLKRTDASAAALFEADEVAAWLDGSLGTLTALGLVREDSPAEVIPCPGCEEQCLETVEIIGEGDGTRAVIVCGRRDDMEPIEVPLESLRRWSVDVQFLADSLALLVSGLHQAEEVAQGRLWWLGRETFGAGRSDVFLACGASWRDGAPVIGGNARLRQCARALVLTLSDTQPDWLPGMVCLSLARLVLLEQGRLSLDRECIENELARRTGRSVRATSRFPTPPGTSWEQVAITITADLDGAVATAGSVTEPVTPDQMGMAYVRNPVKFTEDWKTLLLLSAHGRVTTEDSEAQFITPKRVERLKKKLRQFFGIDEDPFKPYRRVESDDSYDAEKGLLDRRGLHRRRFVGGYEPRFALTRIRR